ncbi:MAG: ribonuclease HI [Bacteroidota bacterium]|nr:ribonuclease HI [Bacteroidota bacterium]
MPGPVIIYTDGSSRGNPGKGGYGVVMMWGKHYKELSCGYRLTTNNRMELLAVIAGLEALKKDSLEVVIYSDSNYVVRAVMEGWLKNWIKKGFKGNIKNRDLWERYDRIARNHRVQFKWVKGHGDNPHNNRCDDLATSAADGRHLLEDTGYESR